MQDQPRGRSLAFHPNAPAVVRFDPFRLDLVDGSLWRGDEEIRLPPRALVILQHLVERAGRIVTKQALMEAAWKDAFVNEASLTEAIGIIRQSLGDDPQHPAFIQTVHRRGYRFIAPLAVDAATAMPAAVAAAGHDAPVAGAPMSVADTASHAPAAAKGTRPVVLIVASALVAAAATATAMLMWSRPTAPAAAATTRLSLTLPADQAPAPALNAHPVVTLTPDGTRVVYQGGQPGASRLFVRRMDQFAATPLAGSENAHGPFVSPDGEWVAFFAGGALRKVRLDGGQPAVICETPTGVGGVWLSNREIVFAPDWTSPLMRVSANGGTPVIAATAAPGFGYRWPDRVDERTVLVTRWKSTARNAAVVAIDLTTRQEQVVAEPAVFGRFASAGHVLFVRDGAVVTVPFDRARRRAAGAPVQVADAVLTGMTGAAQLAISPNGTMLFIADAPERSQRVLAHVDREGRIGNLPIAPRTFRAFSVCGDRVALTIHDRGQSDLWIGHQDRAALTRITTEGTAFEPAWSRDCGTLAFGWNRAGTYEVYAVHPGTGEAPSRLMEAARTQLPGSWSPDGQLLAFVEQHPETKTDIWLLDRRSGQARPFMATPAEEILPRLSPDGRWMAYESGGAGQFEIEVASVATGARTQVSGQGGTWPAWSADGRSLFYLDDETIYRVAVAESAGELRAADPVAVYRDPDLLLFRPSDDGFVILRRTTEHLPLTRVDVVLNEIGEIERQFAGKP